MRDFNRGNNSGRGRSFGSGYKRKFEGRSFDRPRPTMYPAVCSKCGKDCEVPFKPTGEKPVFCRECFRENGGNENRKSDERNFSRPSFQNTQSAPSDNQYKEQLAKVNEKLDAILRILNAAVVPNVALEQEEKSIEQPQETVVEKKKKRVSKKSL